MSYFGLDNNRQQWVKVGLILLILVLAVFLRLRMLDTTGVGEDQSFTVNTAIRWVNGGQIPLAANKSSVGVMNPPMIEYLYAIALRLWSDVLAVSILTMVAGILAVILTGWATYRVFNWRVAFWAMLLFALNPWSVNYSQLIWNQTMIPVFASLTLAALLMYFTVEQKGIYLVTVFFGAACLTQVHPGSIMQLATIGLIMAVFWRKLRLWPVVIGLALFVLLYVPFLIYEVGVGWTDLNATLDFARQSSSLSNSAVLVSLDLLHARGLLVSTPGLGFFDTLATLLFGVALVYALVTGLRSFRHRDSQASSGNYASAIFILLVWLVMPILFYLRTSAYLQIYYLMGQWPAPFILMALPIAGLQQWLENIYPGRLGRIASWSLLVLPILALLGWQIAVSLEVQNSRLDLTMNDVQVRHVREVISQADALIKERPECSLVIVSEGHKIENSRLSLLSEFSSVDHFLLSDGNLALPVPSPCALYLDARPGSPASIWLAEVATPLRQADVKVHDGTWRFYELPAATQADLFQTADDSFEPVGWTNGLTLVEYDSMEIEPGQPLPLTMTWEVKELPPRENYHFGIYLLTSDNQVVAQSDGPGFDSIQWRPGDRFITWFNIPGQSDLPAGKYQLAAALYTWPGLARVDLVEGDNTAFLEQMEVLP